jgi:SAM-dependent methyltransferase
MMPLTGYDAELRRHHDVLRRAYGVQPADHVLDIGCGTGQATRDAARAASDGTALGVDVSAPAVDRARELAGAEQIGNVAFEQADAQVHPFAPMQFDVAISRFGTMFFDDAAAAFGNIRAAMRPAGRLVMMVWQAHERNEWAVAIDEALGAADAASQLPPRPDPFSLADPQAVTKLLEAAGFAGVAFTEVREPVFYGATVSDALDWVHGFTSTAQAMARLDSASAVRAERRLRSMLRSRLREDGVWFESRAWIVTAHRDGGPT